MFLCRNRVEPLGGTFRRANTLPKRGHPSTFSMSPSFSVAAPSPVVAACLPTSSCGLQVTVLRSSPINRLSNQKSPLPQACWSFTPFEADAVRPVAPVTMAVPGKVSNVVTYSFLKSTLCMSRSTSAAPRRRGMSKAGKKEHHLWMRRDSAGSGQKALNLVRVLSKLPDEKEAIYGALDKWCAFETEFPLVAVAKALEILRKRSMWLRVIQVTKWLLNKGQVITMATYDMLLLAFDMDGRVDEAEAIWSTILKKHTRSVSKRLFSRMISIYDHHHMPEKILEAFADMEELGVKPDEDTVKRVGRAFQTLGQEENCNRFLQRYQMKFRYIHFNGERVRVKNSIIGKNRSQEHLEVAQRQ